jgi:tryptophanyl-tRNA synthetase
VAATVLASGVDPEKSTFFVQSAVPAHAQLAWVLNCLAPFGEMERMVQFKEKSEHNPNAINVGLFSYPILQAADILLYRPDMVPVGIDQAQHLELTRTLARKFNNQFCPEDAPLFGEPQTLHTKTLKILGLDGKRKMSKTYNNYISLTATEEELWQALRTGATDPARVRKTDPGNPDICNIFTFHKMFSPQDDQDAMASGCREATMGCVGCKKTLHKNLNNFIAPIRERYEELMKNPDDLRDILASGAKKASTLANETLEKVYELVGYTL